MDTEILVQHGETIGYALVGALALIGVIVIQLVRRRGDVKRARQAVRFASHSITDPRPGPIAINGIYRKTATSHSLERDGQRIALDGEIEIVCGTSARWHRGVRTYALRDGDEVVAIGVMSKADNASWRLAPNNLEPGVKIFAAKPKPAPAPFWPWRAPVFLVLCAGIAFGGLYGIGMLLLDVPRGSDVTPCNDSAMLRFEISAALPVVREQALTELARCAKR